MTNVYRASINMATLTEAWDAAETRMKEQGVTFDEWVDVASIGQYAWKPSDAYHAFELQKSRSIPGNIHLKTFQNSLHNPSTIYVHIILVKEMGISKDDASKRLWAVGMNIAGAEVHCVIPQSANNADMAEVPNLTFFRANLFNILQTWLNVRFPYPEGIPTHLT